MKMRRFVPAILGAMLLAIGHPAMAEQSPGQGHSADLPEPKVTQLRNSKPTHMLFVGNSYF